MRHRKKIAAALVAGLIGLGGWLAYPREAACAWCPSFTCYSSSWFRAATSRAPRPSARRTESVMAFASCALPSSR